MSEPLDFDALVREHGRYVHIQIMKIVGPEHVDDVAQQMWMTVWRKRDQFRGDAKPRTWLHICARNHALTFLRKQKRRLSPIPLDVLLDDGDAVRPEFVDDLPRADALVLARERWTRLNDRIFALDQIFQETAIVAFDGVTMREGAAICGVPLSTYKTRLARLREKLATSS